MNSKKSDDKLTVLKRNGGSFGAFQERVSSPPSPHLLIRTYVELHVYGALRFSPAHRTTSAQRIGCLSMRIFCVPHDLYVRSLHVPIRAGYIRGL